jgi:hypothetical protein
VLWFQFIGGFEFIGGERNFRAKTKKNRYIQRLKNLNGIFKVTYHRVTLPCFRHPQDTPSLLRFAANANCCRCAYDCCSCSPSLIGLVMWMWNNTGSWLWNWFMVVYHTKFRWTSRSSKLCFRLFLAAFRHSNNCWCQIGRALHHAT